MAEKRPQQEKEPRQFVDLRFSYDRGVVLHDISRERDRQERLREAGKFPATCADPTRSDAEKLPVLIEEVGEAARAMCEAGGATDVQSAGLRDELVQVAAVAVAWIEAIDARKVVPRG